MKNLLITALAAGALACASNGQDADKVSLTFQAQLDSGNAAYRRGDYKASAKFFHLATKSEPENLSGYYGVYMAESKLGNTEAASKAKAFVAKQAPEMPLEQHPTAKEHPGSLSAPKNPHVPQGEDPHAKLPLDSIRAAKEKT